MFTMVVKIYYIISPTQVKCGLFNSDIFSKMNLWKCHQLKSDIKFMKI